MTHAEDMLKELDAHTVDEASGLCFCEDCEECEVCEDLREEQEVAIRMEERDKIASAIQNMAVDLLYDKEGDTLDGYVAAVLLAMVPIINEGDFHE